MNNIEAIEERIQLFIINNLKNIQDLIKPYRELRDALNKNEPSIFHNEIDDQYNETIKSVISVYIAKCLQIDALNVILVIESMDVTQI